VEGQLLALTVDVGDRVEQGQILARLDDQILQGALSQAKAEKAAQRSAVVSAQSQVGDAQIKVEQARLQLQQAEGDILRLRTSLSARIEQARLEAQQTQADADRLQLLAEEGATAAQAAEQAQTRAKQARQILVNEQASADQQIAQAQTAAQTAAKILRSAEAQVAIGRQRVATAEAQVTAQKALIDQSQTRQSFATLRSPISGKVLRRVSESGNLVQPGTELLTLGDFSQIKVAVEVSELKLPDLQVGQSLPVVIDAFPDRSFTGTLTRISPAADPITRLIPVEVVIDNPSSRIGSGLLARVRFDTDNTVATTAIVPETALNDDNTIFVIKEQGKQAIAQARSVTVGNKADGQVEILEGLALGESFVVRSSRPLKDNTPVRLSVLSEGDRPVSSPKGKS
jgi:RND family efflux transporter MFP subunit